MMNIQTKLRIGCFSLLLAVLTPLRGADPVPSFDGDNSYINLGTPAELQIASGQPFTVEGWIYLRNADTRNMLFCKNNRSTSYSYMLGFIDNTTMAAYSGSEKAWKEPSPSVMISVDGWHHAAYSYDGTNMAFFIDGVLKGSNTFTFANTPSHQISIGGFSNASDIDGMYSDVRFWNHARSATQIEQYMNSRLTGAESGLLGYWPLNEGTGTLVYDLTTGITTTGTLVNATWLDASAPDLAMSADTLVVDGVPGQYGSPEPPYGNTNRLASLDSFICSATGTWAVATGTRAYCLGYQLYTNGSMLVASGDTNAFSYTHDAGALLKWQWQRQYAIAFAADTGGEVSTIGGWYEEGSNVTVTANATDPLRHFSFWTGDIPAGMETDATLTFAADQPRTISAYFGASYHVSTNGSDTADGLSWETAKLTLQSALADAQDGDTVLVSNGVYSTTSQIAVTNGVTVRSVNGTEHTVISRTSGGERLVLLKHADALFDGFTITKGAYGAVYIDGAGTLENCIISNNVTARAVTDGAGVYLKSGGIVKNCQIINNQVYITAGSSRSGGGVYMNGGGLVDSCVISNNTVSPGGTGSAFGGGIYMSGTTCTLRNSLIAQNFARMNGGGIYCIGGTIESCTIVDNTTPNVAGAGGLYNNNGKIINTIIAYNSNPNGLSNYQNAGSPTYSHSCTDPEVSGVNNTALAPQFVDLYAQDYRLLAGPCVNTGLNQDWMTTALDVVGNSRIVSGTVDMGAYELVPGALRIGFEGVPTEGIASNLVVFTAFASGANTTALYYAWSFNNDETVDIEGFGRSVVTNLYWPGLYSVSLTVSNAIGEVETLVREQYIKVAPTTAYVSTNGAAIYPYNTWAKAATDIQSALDVGVDGTLVLVSNGVYDITSRIDMPLNITLRSVNGSENTKIQLTSKISGMFYLTVPEAVIDGFTITYATGASTPDAAVFLNAGGIVSNCVIRDISTSGSGGSGGGVRMNNGGWLKNCLVINNYRSSSGGGSANGGGVYMSGTTAMIESCIISNNTSGAGIGAGGGVYMTSGTLRNSLISGNRHNTSAGGVYASGGTIENCTIADNATLSERGVGGLDNRGMTIRNSIIHNNRSAIHLNNYSNTGAAKYYNCCTWPITDIEGSDNLDSDPQFYNPSTQDYRLRPGSCVDAGLNQEWMTNALDIAGDPRIQNLTVDIGAFEYADGVLLGSFEGTPLQGLANNEVVFTAYADGTNITDLTYAWSFNNDATIDIQGIGQSVVTHSYSPGLYSVKLTVSNAAGETDTYVREDYILVAPTTTYVTTNGASIPPYNTWANAATNIHDAVSASWDGTQILVSNGVYEINRQIELLNGITIRSINGAASTEIRRSSGNSRIFFVGHPSAVIDGFTLANANLGAVYLESGGTVSNCVIRNNNTLNKTTEGSGVYMVDGLVKRCHIINNVVNCDRTTGMSGGGIYMTGGAVEDCVISNNIVTSSTSAGYGGGIYMDGASTQLRNCLVYGNSHSMGAGGVYCKDGLVENCTVASNWSTYASGPSGGLQCNNATIRNTIVQDNRVVDTINNYSNTGESWTYQNCNTSPIDGLTGSDNIDADPLFKDVARGDYRLTSDSPCINAGAYQPWMEGALDLAGEPRILNQAVDIGAYEGHLPGGTLMIIR